MVFVPNRICDDLNGYKDENIEQEQQIHQRKFIP